MRRGICFRAALAAALAILVRGSAPAASPVVTADLQSLEAAADAPLVVFVRPTPRGGEFSLGFRNESAGEVTAILRLSSVPFDAVDIYNAGAFLGSFSREQLSAGVPVRLSGGVLPPEQRSLLELHEALLEEMNHTLSITEKRTVAGARMLGLREMVRAILVADRAERSARLVLVEKGKATSRRIPSSRVDGESLRRQARDVQEDVERVRQSLKTAGLTPEEQARYQGWLLPVQVLAERTGPETLRVSAVNRSALHVRAVLRISSEGQEERELSFDIPPGRTGEAAVPLKEGSSGKLVATLEGKAGDVAFSRRFGMEAGSGR